MRAALLVPTFLVVIGCKSERTPAPGAGTASAAPTGQTYRDALGILCGAGVQPPGFADVNPAEREQELGRWLDQTITNPEGRAFVTALADARDRVATIRRAATAAGLDACTPLALFTERAIGGANVADVTSVAGTGELDQELPVLVITPTAVVVEGMAVIPIAADHAEPADVARLTTFLAALAKNRGEPLTAMTVAADRTLTAGVLLGVLDVLQAAGVTRVDLAVGAAGRELRVVPLVFAGAPYPRQPPYKGKPPAPIGMQIFIHPDRVTVWSEHGSEGTGTAPLVELPTVPPDTIGAALQDALHGVVVRQWATVGRHPFDHRIMLRAAPAAKVQALAEVVAAVRATADGTPLFPEIAVAPGIR